MRKARSGYEEKVLCLYIAVAGADRLHYLFEGSPFARYLLRIYFYD